MKKSLFLTPGEFELMEILWQLGEASVKEVWGRIQAHRDIAYTTVMTVLDKMRRKGILSQRRKGKAFLYSPAIPRDQALQDVVAHLLRTYFRGSLPELLSFLNQEVSPAAVPGRIEDRSGQAPPKCHNPEVPASDPSIDEVLL